MRVSPPCKRGDLALVIIDANDGVTHLCKTNGGDKADVSGADNSNLNVFVHSDGERCNPVLTIENIRLCEADFNGQKGVCLGKMVTNSSF